jgi:glycosyltransferase involved in cell wall biosynthesis
MSGPGFSIALCAYNGGRFLKEQLESFRSQTWQPGELVAVDDCSRDATVTILEEYAETAPFPVRIHRNAENLGVRANFTKALGLCNGELIALSDQDDVWLPRKLEQLGRALLSGPDVLGAFSDADVVDEKLRPLGDTVWRRTGFTVREQGAVFSGDAARVLLKHYTVTGAAFAVKKSLLARALPVPDGWGHDAWLALMAALAGRLLCVPAPLLLYRQHGANVIGAKRKNALREILNGFAVSRGAYYAEELPRYLAARERLLPARHPLLEEKIAHLTRRRDMPKSRAARVWPWALEALQGGYARYAKDFRVAAWDLVGRE